MKIRKICINCPAGCHLAIETDETGTITVSGNKCPRGKAYAESEVRDPRRIVTAVAPADDDKTFVPVRSNIPVPLKMIAPLLLEIYALRVKLPVSAGTVLIRDFQNSGINVCASRSFVSEKQS